MRLGTDYHRFWSAGLASNLGDGISLVVYPWLASVLTTDPFLIGLTLALWRAPWLLLSLPMGALLDRMNRFDVMGRANLARTVVAMVVALLFQFDLMNIWIFFCCVFLLGTCTVLYQIAAETVVPSLVDGRRLEQAYGRLWSVELLASQFGGPLIAGALMGSLLFVPLTASAATTALAVLLLSLVSTRSSADAAPSARRGLLGEAGHACRQIREALVYLWADHRLRTLALTLAALNPVIAMVQATFILYVQEVLDGGSLVYGALLAAGGVGGILGGMCATRVIKTVPTGLVLCSFFYIAAVVNVGMALVPVPILVGVLNFGLNFAVIVWNVVGRSSRQRIMSESMRGRVTSTIRWLGWGLIPVGFLAGGLIVKLLEPVIGRDWSLRAPMLAGAALFVLIGLVASPRLARVSRV